MALASKGHWTSARFFVEIRAVLETVKGFDNLCKCLAEFQCRIVPYSLTLNVGRLGILRRWIGNAVDLDHAAASRQPVSIRC